LIQGPNESGKSALIESIYFALYGEPLITSRSKRSLDDLIQYGASTASVSLVLSVGATELHISRLLDRGLGQKISLLVHQLGMPDEDPITDLAVANERIINELGGMDGETLRNSGLVAQKELTRLEVISGSERERTIHNLLGLEALSSLSTQFQVTPADEEQLHVWSERLELAEIQARIPVVSQQLEDLEAALDAVNVHESLSEIEQQESELSELDQTLEDVYARRLDVRSQLGRVQQLKKADSTLAEIISSYDEIAEARRELPSLEIEIANLERQEREELPRIEKRVSDLADLARSFGTLQRMSNDLLTAVDAIKEFELQRQEYKEVKQDLEYLNEQVEQARVRLNDAEHSWHEMDQQRRAQRPQLEARLQRLQNLSTRLHELHQAEESYSQRVAYKSSAEKNKVLLQRKQSELQEAEQQVTLLEQDTLHLQQQADAAEQAWHQLSVRQHLEEWYHFSKLAQDLTQAEQQLTQARQQQEKLTTAMVAARDRAMTQMMFTIGCVIGFLVFLVLALVLIAVLPLAILFAVVAGGCLLVAGTLWRNYRRARIEEQTLKLQEQEAVSRVGMMVATREAAMRQAGSSDALFKVENEIRSLGSSVPQSLEDAQRILEQPQNQGNLYDAQQQMRSTLDEVNTSRNQLNQKKERLVQLREEWRKLDEQRKREEWDSIEVLLQDDQALIERLQQEVTLLAGQDGLPIASINARIKASPILAQGAVTPFLGLDADEITDLPSLENLAATTMKATENELVALDGDLDATHDLTHYKQTQQDALDMLLERQHVAEERFVQYQSSSPEEQLERAREQQVALRSALQSLQDSLRQRVKPLGVTFGQSAISSAEISARKNLEELHLTLGNKIMLQERLSHYNEVLQERQDALSELYKQLAKFSNTLGSWVVPLNPFAEALDGLRGRCQEELTAADEQGLLAELDTLKDREIAAKLKMELCQQEITNLENRISTVLAQRDREQPGSYVLADLAAVWPLLDEYTVSQRADLDEQLILLERELDQLEKQELTLSRKLGIGDETLDLEQTREHLQELDRSYQTRLHGHRLIEEVQGRVLQKILPRTEYYMQLILPLLTGHRYHDVHLLTVSDEAAAENGDKFQIEVWDSAAGEYLPTSALSGGAADQISFALRLAFAIATLPQELSAAPGFLLLDEPLSSFDRGRGRALVDVVTGDILSQHFEQIILISHSSTFDPALFPYHLYVDNGLVVESNLPVVALPDVVFQNIPASMQTPLSDESTDSFAMVSAPGISILSEE
jgi:DNA repair exonuclease SbcCD ATPase subunit